MSDFANYRRDLAVLDPAGGRVPQIQHNPPTAGPGLSQVAPWMSSNGGASSPALGGVMSTSFYNDSSDNVSTASQLSPAFRVPTGGRPSQTSGSNDSPDVAYFNDERRPSLASINTVNTTASSQGSKASGTRGGLRKLQGFFGEEFPGRDSSETSLGGKDHRSHSYSHGRSHRDRNYSNATDRDASPASSRPRTPVPAPEVVPFLYQDAEVGPHLPSHNLFVISLHSSLSVCVFVCVRALLYSPFFLRLFFFSFLLSPCRSPRKLPSPNQR